MLKSIKQSISNAPCITFGQYFTRYVLQVQDNNIDSEVTFLLRNNAIDPLFLNRVMNMEMKED